MKYNTDITINNTNNNTNGEIQRTKPQETQVMHITASQHH